MQKEIKAYLSYLEFEQNASPLTIKQYAHTLKLFTEFMNEKNTKLNDIDHKFIRAFLAKLRERNLSNNTVSSRLYSIKSFFKYCVRMGYLPFNPVDLVSTPRYMRPIPSFLTEKEAQAFLDCPIATIRDRTILELLYGSGLRVSELVGINLEDICLDTRTIRVLGKGRKWRVAFFGQRAERVLKHYLSTRYLLKLNILTKENKNLEETALFLNNMGERLGCRGIERMVEKYRVLLGIEKKVSPHSFRHSFASHLLGSGAGIREIQEFLGHSSISTTEKYTHISTKSLIETYKKAHPKA